MLNRREKIMKKLKAKYTEKSAIEALEESGFEFTPEQKEYAEQVKQEFNALIEIGRSCDAKAYIIVRTGENGMDVISPLCIDKTEAKEYLNEMYNNYLNSEEPICKSQISEMKFRIERLHSSTSVYAEILEVDVPALNLYTLYENLRNGVYSER